MRGGTNPAKYDSVLSGASAAIHSPKNDLHIIPVASLPSLAPCLEQLITVALFTCWARATVHDCFRLLSAAMKSPLFDTRLVTRNLERAYEAMWEQRALGLAPSHIGTR